jgi:cell wall-associated NlpC family hydrolase
LQLSELHRFTDPTEAAASLALRGGDPRALGFYLDHRRVHVGGLAKATEDAFAAWVADRAVGLDAIMLAPTRELVADLNRRARDHRRGSAWPGQEIELSDGNRASIGDVIITRSNDRRLRPSATDWVKNGDRWTITHITKQGDLRVRHTRSHGTVRLPAGYVCTSTGLGYATTIHGAQGVSADTMHGLLTGQESRQQLDTMLTRGRHANHLYLQVVGDGDPHSLIRPESQCAQHADRGPAADPRPRRLRHLRHHPAARTDLAALAEKDKQLKSLTAASDKNLDQAKKGLAKLTAEQQKQRAEAEKKATAKTNTEGQDVTKTSQDSTRSSTTGNSKGAKALAYAKAQLGEPYVRNGDGPSSWDCSGLTMMAWGSVGVSLPHSSGQQFNRGQPVAKSDLQQGDLVFFYSDISHVGIYAGNGQVIHAPRPGKSVEYIKMSYMPYAGARRPG